MTDPAGPPPLERVAAEGGRSVATVQRTFLVPSTIHVLLQVQLLCVRGTP